MIPPVQKGGQNHPDRRQDDALRGDGFDFGVFGVHPSGEKDDAQGHHADELGDGRAIELDAQTVAAEQHPHAEEQQQHGNAELVAGFPSQNAHKQENRSH